MTFEEILDQAVAMLQRRGRVTYRTLQRQCDLDDAWSVCGSPRTSARRAYDLLAPVYGWFTEGFGTVGLQEAKALLDDLQR